MNSNTSIRLKAAFIFFGVLVFAFGAYGYASAFFNADLSIYKSGPATAPQGGTVVYSITVTNNGPSPVTGGYTIGDTIPSQTTFNSGLSTPGCSMYPGRYDLVTCSDPNTLPVGAVKSFTLAFNIPSYVACNTVLNNVVAVNSGIPDPNTANNHSSIVQGGPVRTTVVCPVPPPPPPPPIVINCTTSSDCGTNGFVYSPSCQGNNVYQYYRTYTCNNPGTVNSYCSNSTNAQLQTACGSNQTCQNGSCYGQNCTSRSYQQCQGNNLYWYDSCGNQQELAQYCQNGCNTNQCQQYSPPYYPPYYPPAPSPTPTPNPACNSRAYKLCLGNNSYWYDSCGNQQDLAQTCYGANQACQYGACVQKPQPPVPPYVSHYKTGCYGSNLYWYDSQGVKTDLYKNCQDSNTCTADSCGAGKCSNVLKCDGSTCAVGSADYNIYCKTDQPAPSFSIAFLVKEEATSTDWKKSANAGQNDQVYFMLSVVNNGSTQLDNVNVSANIPAEVALLGNLQVNGAAAPGDIVAGINIGSLPPATAKSITFDGKTQLLLSQATRQATATASISGATQSDTVSLSFEPGQVAGVSTASSGFWNFLKRWYLWILVALVLIFLFVIVFRRLSSTNNA